MTIILRLSPSLPSFSSTVLSVLSKLPFIAAHSVLSNLRVLSSKDRAKACLILQGRHGDDGLTTVTHHEGEEGKDASDAGHHSNQTRAHRDDNQAHWSSAGHIIDIDAHLK